MSYNITKFNGEQFALVADGTINNTLDITLIGKNYAGYGEKQNENFLWLLEHFANATPPPKAIKGQVWFNTTSDKLKLTVYDGVTWKSLAINSITTPSNPVPSINPKLGDMWYDETSKQLKVFNGSDYTLVGPQSVTGYGITQMKSVEIEDSQSNFRAIQEAWANGQRVFVINSNADFTPKNNIAGFTTIFQGVTLNSSYKLYGTATNSEKLGGQLPAFYAPITNPTFSTSINVPNDGVNIGTAFTIKNLSGIPTIKNNSGDTVKFQTTSGSTVNTPLQLVGKDILPGVNFGTDLGSTIAQFNNVYASYIYSTSQKADSLNLSGNYLTATTSAGPNTIAARDSSGNLTATRFLGLADTATNATTAQTATYATNALRAVSSNEADLVAWANVSGKPTNFVYNNGQTYNINISGNANSALAVPFSGIGDKPTTLSGYGITDSVASSSLANSATITARTDAVIDTIVLRDQFGNSSVKKLYADGLIGSAGGSLITGTWTLDVGARFQATYADLAERFEADEFYDTGTVVELGGTAEVTSVKDDLSSKVFGVVSTSAAYLMNSQAGTDETHPAIAVSGRVPVKVSGKVKKGDRLVSAGNGIARAADISEITAFNTIGRALKDKNTTGTGIVEAIVTIK